MEEPSEISKALTKTIADWYEKRGYVPCPVCSQWPAASTYLCKRCSGFGLIPWTDFIIRG